MPPRSPLSRFARGVLHPEAFHGAREDGPFFEGWYVKLVAGSGRTVVLIPGVFKGGDEPHAFVMAADSAVGGSRIARYGTDSFAAADDGFDLAVGASRFHADGCEVDVVFGDRSVRGAVGFSDLEPWPVSRRAPGCMG